MKISKAQLEMAMSKMGYELLGYGSSKHDLVLDISFTEEDPGNGSMIECLTIRATKPGEVEAEGETRMEVEIYPENTKLEPRASKINTFKITKNY